MGDGLRCLAAIRPLLPASRAEAMLRKARERIALRAMDEAAALWNERQFALALRQIREGLLCRVSLRVVKSLILLPLQTRMRTKRKSPQPRDNRN